MLLRSSQDPSTGNSSYRGHVFDFGRHDSRPNPNPDDLIYSRADFCRTGTCLAVQAVAQERCGGEATARVATGNEGICWYIGHRDRNREEYCTGGLTSDILILHSLLYQTTHHPCIIASLSVTVSPDRSSRNLHLPLHCRTEKCQRPVSVISAAATLIASN
jgi:hypothetical protein